MQRFNRRTDRKYKRCWNPAPSNYLNFENRILSLSSLKKRIFNIILVRFGFFLNGCLFQPHLNPPDGFRSDEDVQELAITPKRQIIPSYLNLRSYRAFLKLERIHGDHSRCRPAPLLRFSSDTSQLHFPPHGHRFDQTAPANTNMLMRLVIKLPGAAAFPQASPLHHRVAAWKFRRSLWQMFTA